MDFLNIIGSILILQFGGLFLLFVEVAIFTALVPFMNKLKITKINPLDPFKITGKNVTLNSVLVLILALSINAILFSIISPLLYHIFSSMDQGAIFQLQFLR